MMRQRGRGGRDCSGSNKEARDGDEMFFASAVGMGLSSHWRRRGRSFGEIVRGSELESGELGL
jgi:hypothetical protein